MIRLLLFSCCLFITIPGISQDQRPVFQNRADSLQYARIRELSNRIFSNRPASGYFTGQQANTLDSLYKAEDVLRKRITWQYVYRPRASFTSYKDLKKGKVSPEEIRSLSISDLKSARVPDEVLRCKNLEELELVNTSIDKIQEELNQLEKLTVIYILNNIPSGKLTLEYNDHISYLRIAGNHPEKLPATYKNFTQLDSLNLTRSGASKFPNVKKNNTLIKLTLIENNITLKKFNGNPTLEYLDLRRNKITVVPNKIARKFRSLTDLSFNMNRITKVKPGLGKLEKLEYLSFYANGITEIPKSVYKLKNLRIIDLFDNRIEFVSPEIKNLQNLEVLYLANNRLYSLPEEIGTLKNLRELYVYNNRMDTLPASMDNLEKLQVLWVNDNFFHTIPATTWRVRNMTYLDASQNFIKRVPDEVADAKLSTLILSGYLMNRENENPDLFNRLRKQGTKIIYYTADSDTSANDDR